VAFNYRGEGFLNRRIGFSGTSLIPFIAWHSLQTAKFSPAGLQRVNMAKMPAPVLMAWDE
jgi:hypothetical protein